MIKDESFLRHTLTETWDVVMDIPIALDILIWLLGYPKIPGKCYFSEFSHAEIISACPRTIICNKSEQNNMIGEIFNSGDNVDDQEDSWFTGSYLKIAPKNIDDYTKINVWICNENIWDHREI